jgi:arabinogalactan endo-1,4-beta-galactosidase
MTKKDIQEYLDLNGFESLTGFDGTKYYNEKAVVRIALEILKNSSITDVVMQIEQLVCPVCESQVIISDKRHDVKMCGVCKHQFSK